MESGFSVPPRYTQYAIDSLVRDMGLKYKLSPDYAEWMQEKKEELARIEEARKFWASVDARMKFDGFVRNQYPVRENGDVHKELSGYFRKSDRRFVTNEEAARITHATSAE